MQVLIEEEQVYTDWLRYQAAFSIAVDMLVERGISKREALKTVGEKMKAMSESVKVGKSKFSGYAPSYFNPHHISSYYEHDAFTPLRQQ